MINLLAMKNLIAMMIFVNLPATKNLITININLIAIKIRGTNRDQTIAGL